MTIRHPEVPDHAVITGQVLITAWLDSDGAPVVTTTPSDDLDRLSTVGPLEFAKLGLYAAGSGPEELE